MSENKPQEKRPEEQRTPLPGTGTGPQGPWWQRVNRYWVAAALVAVLLLVAVVVGQGGDLFGTAGGGEPTAVGITRPDADGDGVPDDQDTCPNEGDAGYGLDAQGCPNPAPDADGDGVPDDQDACPNQGDAGYGLDAQGCPNPAPDADGDGVPDDQDTCPYQGDEGYGLQENGCPALPPDADGDSVPDDEDDCPNEGDQGYGVDERGCPESPPDMDNDGVPDDDDDCPNEGDAGYGVDAQGCPNPAPDADGDGVPDDQDACPNEGDAGYGLGADGCPNPVPTSTPTITPMPDTDGDGVLDAYDTCPNEGDAGYGVDENGCPNPAPDADGDGVPNDQDACPNQGDEGAGVDAQGCPNAPGAEELASGVSAAFEAFVAADGTVQFHDQSTGVVASWVWNFGDGATANIQNPSHIYANPGTYTVTLTVTGDDGMTSTAQGEVTITEQQAAPMVCKFDMQTQGQAVPLDVLFTNLSTNAISYAWDFGNGQTSNDFGPHTITYTQTGQYHITLDCTDAQGNTITAHGYLNVSEQQVQQPLVAGFTAQPPQGVAPLNVVFTDVSTSDPNDPIVAWAWDFGNGQTASTQGPHQVLYDAAERYGITLTVTTQSGLSAQAFGVVEVVEPTSPPSPSIDAQPLQGDAPLTVTITGLNDGGPIDTWTWDFGNGQTATGKGPHTVTYDTVGTYLIQLAVDGPGGGGFATQQVVVTEAGAVVQAIFSYGEPTFNADGTVDVCFNNDSIGEIVHSVWDVDGTAYDFTETPMQQVCHTFPAEGTYTVKLAVYGAAQGEYSDTTRLVPLYQGVPAPVAHYSSDRTEVEVGGTVHFTDQSTGIITTWEWDFDGDGVVDSTEQNPSFTFDTAGTYTVLLTVTGPGGSAQATDVTVTVSVPALECHLSGRREVRLGEQVTYELQTNAGEREISYTWAITMPGGLSQAGTPGDVPRFTYTFTQLGIYTVKGIATADDGSTCESSITVEVTVPAISCQIEGPAYVFPADARVEYTGVVQGLDGREVAFAWMVDGENEGSSQTFSPEWSEGSHTLTFSAITPDGAYCEADLQVEVTNELTCELHGDFTVVPGQQVSYRVTTSDLGTYSASYQWYVDGELVEGVEGNSYALAWQHGTHSIRVVVSAGGVQCEAGGEQNVHVEYGELRCRIRGNREFPPGAQSIYAEVSNEQGRTLTEYVWYINGELVEGETGPTLTRDWEEGTYTVRYEVRTEDGSGQCGGEITITVKKPDLTCHSPRGTGSPYVMQTVTYQPRSQTLAYYANTGYEISYTWELLDVDGNVVATGDQANFGYTFTQADARYKVRYTVRVVKGDDVRECHASRGIHVRDVAFKCRYISGSGSASHLDRAYTYTAKVYNPSNLPLTYTWSTGDVHSGVTGNSDAIQHVWGAAGNYTLAVTVTGPDGSATTCEMQKNVRAGYLKVDFKLDKNQIHVGEQVCVDNVSRWGGDVAPSFAWDFGNGQSSTEIEPGCITYDAAGSYNITLTGQLNDLSGQKTRRVTVLANAELSAQANPEAVLVGERVTFTTTGTNVDENSYQWYIPGLPNPISGQSVSYVFNAAGTYTVRVTAMSDLGLLEATADVTVSESADIRAAFQPDKWAALAPAQFCFTDMSEQQGQLNSWAWDFGDGTISNEQNPCHTYSAVGDWNVSLTVTNVYGLSASATNIVHTYAVGGGGGSWEYEQKAGGEVCFTSRLDEGYSVVEWQFGDGGTSTEANPCYTYEQSGDYVVALQVTDGQLTYPIVRRIRVSVYGSEELPNLRAVGVCMEGEGGAFAHFAITNTGGDMPQEDTAVITQSDGTVVDTFTFQLKKGETVTRSVSALYGDLTLTTSVYQVEASVSSCVEAPNIMIVAVCLRESGIVKIAIGNLGGPMLSEATFTITYGDERQSGSLQLGRNQSADFSIPIPRDGSNVVITVEGEGISEETVVEGCYVGPSFTVSGRCDLPAESNNPRLGDALFEITNNGGDMFVANETRVYTVTDAEGQVVQTGVVQLGVDESMTVRVVGHPGKLTLNLLGEEASADTECYPPPRLSGEAYCAADGTSVFVVTNNGGDMVASGFSVDYTLDYDGGQESGTIQLGTGESVRITRAEPYGVMTLNVPGMAPLVNSADGCFMPEDLSLGGQCDVRTGATTFTIFNGGGDMVASGRTATYAISDAAGVFRSETFQLGAGETLTLEVADHFGDLTLRVEDEDGLTLTADVTCYQPPALNYAGECTADGTALFTATNTGGDMRAPSHYQIVNAYGDVVAEGDYQLAAGESQTFTVGGYYGTVSFVDGGVVAANTVCALPPTATPIAPPPTSVPPAPVCGQTLTDANGFPIIDMNPAACGPQEAPHMAWSPIEIGEAVCPDWLVYHTNQTGDWEIFRLGKLPNGTDEDNVNLTQGVGERVYDVAPSRSPDAMWIAFASNRDGNWEIYVGKADGSEQRRVTYTVNAIDVDPVWSPQGDYIAYESARDGNWELYMVDVASGAEFRLTDNPANDINPFWSPDGSKIVFQSDRDGLWQIYELNIATGEERRLSDGTGDDHDPAYSFDGTQIAFRSYRDGDNSVIYVMDADGGNVTRISDPAADASNHAWSDDDQLLAYQAYGVDGDDMDVYVYDFASGQTRLVTDNDVPDYAPTWYCDGHTLVFTSDVLADDEHPANSNLFATNADPVDAPPIDVAAEAMQLTSELDADQYPEDTPAEENASRQGALPGPAKH